MRKSVSLVIMWSRLVRRSRGAHTFLSGSRPLPRELRPAVDTGSPPSTCRPVLLSPAICEASASSSGPRVKQTALKWRHLQKAAVYENVAAKEMRGSNGGLNATLDQRQVRTFLDISQRATWQHEQIYKVGSDDSSRYYISVSSGGS